MTPLAHQLARYLTVPIKCRPEFWRGPELAILLNDIHCFEVSAVLNMAFQIAGTALAGEVSVSDIAGERVFLPAQKTWIELGPSRVAYLLEEVGPGVIEMTAVREAGTGLTHVLGIHSGEPGQHALVETLRALLCIINSPKIIGRRQHMPHVGLERALRRAAKSVGKYPLHAWSEILLEARPTFVDDSGIGHEAHLTGSKCLHFCRAHLRIRNGQLEIVSPHWRGDPALGIKRSRYKVVPPASRAGRTR